MGIRNPAQASLAIDYKNCCLPLCDIDGIYRGRNCYIITEWKNVSALEPGTNDIKEQYMNQRNLQIEFCEDLAKCGKTVYYLFGTHEEFVQLGAQVVDTANTGVIRAVYDTKTKQWQHGKMNFNLVLKNIATANKEKVIGE